MSTWRIDGSATAPLRGCVIGRSAGCAAVSQPRDHEVWPHAVDAVAVGAITLPSLGEPLAERLVGRNPRRRQLETAVVLREPAGIHHDPVRIVDVDLGLGLD